MKKLITRILVVLLIVLVIISGIVTSIHLEKNYNTILKIQTAPAGYGIRNTWSWKNPKYFTISINGKVTKTSPTLSFKKVKNQIIDIDNNTFDSYDDEKNDETRLKIVKKPILKDQYGKTVHDKNYTKMMKQMTKYIHSDILAIRFFKTEKYYYVAFGINQFISDETDLYRFNPKNNQLKKICALNKLDVVKIQELK